MDWLRTLLSRCKAFLIRNKLDQELEEEFRSHLEFATEENRKRGMPEDDARRAAMRAFGGMTQIQERYRLRRGLPLLDTIAQDVRFAARQIRRAPGFAAVAIITLALGIGANTAVFTLTHALLLRTLPVRDPGELVRLAIDVSATETDGRNAPLNLPIIEAIEKRSRSFHFGLAGSWFITSIKRVTTISVAESEPPGWPDFASVIISITSRRICLAMAASSAGLLVFCITFFRVTEVAQKGVHIKASGARLWAFVEKLSRAS